MKQSLLFIFCGCGRKTMKQEFIHEMVAPSEKKIVSSTVDFSCKIPVVTNFTLMYNLQLYISCCNFLLASTIYSLFYQITHLKKYAPQIGKYHKFTKDNAGGRKLVLFQAMPRDFIFTDADNWLLCKQVLVIPSAPPYQQIMILANINTEE